MAMSFPHASDKVPVLAPPPPAIVVTLIAEFSVDQSATEAVLAILPALSLSHRHTVMMGAAVDLFIDILVGDGDETPGSTTMVLESLRTAVNAALKDRTPHVDAAVQAHDIHRRYKRLIVFDMDSTLIQLECIDRMARHAGVEDEVKLVTEAAMRGEMDFSESLRQRVARLKGQPTTVFQRVIDELVYSPGAKELVETLTKLGYVTAVISGGFTDICDWVRQDLGLTYAFSNVLARHVNEDGVEVLDGTVVGDIVDSSAKARILVEIAKKHNIARDQVIAVGDGANDIPMLHRAALGVAYNAKPKVQAQAKYCVNTPSLEAVRYMLGISDQEAAALHSAPPFP